MSATRTQSSLHKYLKESGRLFIAEVNGEMWFTDSYLAAPVPLSLHLLMADYNLKVEPMNCDVAATIRRRDGDVPPVELAKLVPEFTKALREVKPLTLGSHPVLTEGVGSQVVEHWSLDGKTASHAFDHRKLQILALVSAEPMRLLVDPEKGQGSPVLVVNGDDETLGLIMPVRSLASEVGWAKAA